MDCPKCKTPGEHKVFSSFAYWYCHDCKDEIQPEPKLLSPRKSAEPDLPLPPAYYLDWTQLTGGINGYGFCNSCGSIVSHGHACGVRGAP